LVTGIPRRSTLHWIVSLWPSSSGFKKKTIFNVRNEIFKKNQIKKEEDENMKKRLAVSS
jgi:hypothetical protein